MILAFIGLESCKKNESQNDPEANKVVVETPVSVACYKALYESDTINLKINTLKYGKISGDMTMKLVDMPEKVGKIAGEFRGDTLFVDYTFIQGSNERKTFKNPMAMLKRDNKLILGNGKIETYMGRSYFVKNQPIDFESVKYIFKSIDCVDK